MASPIARYTSSALRHAGAVRKISISSHTPITGENADISSTISDQENIKDVPQLVSTRTLETAEFRALGNPQTVLNINSPASVPVHIRRGSLLSIYGTSPDVNSSSVSTVRSTLEVIKPFRRWFYGRYASSYQKLVSTAPFSVLVSANSRKLFSLSSSAENKSFANLVLDGSNDWAVLNKDALQVYTGNSLIVSVYSLPRVISRKLLKRLGLKGTQKTGLFSWYRSGYTLLSGRGQVGLVGNGSIYNINLGPEEELLVNKKNLLGITVNGPFDLNNCTHKYTFPVANEGSESAAVGRPVLSLGQVHQQPISAVSKAKEYWRIIASYFGAVGRYFGAGKSITYNFLVGNQDFIKVLGPRSLLLQSNGNEYFANRPRKSPKKIASQASAVVHPERTSADYLNYVTIENGKGVFKSTPDFKKTVNEIEKKKESS